MKLLWICAALCLLKFSVPNFADKMAFANDIDTLEYPCNNFANCSPKSWDGPGLQFNIPETGFFLGLGGSYSSVKFDQYLTASGASDFYIDSALVGTGSAGPAVPFHGTQTTFAPTAQLGYFGSCPCSDWVWGAKLSYKYLGVTFTDEDIDTPQSGAITPTADAPAGSTHDRACHH